MASMFVPQLVPSVDLSKGLAQLGSTIGGLREDAAIADIMRDIRPDDPFSYDRTIRDLQAYGSPTSRDMADRLLGVRNQREQHQQSNEFARGNLDVSRGRLTLEQQRYANEQANQKAFETGMADYRTRLGGTSSAAPAVAPPAGAIRRVPAGETDYWKDATEEEGGKPAAAAPAGASPTAQAPASPVVGGFATEPAPGVRAAGGLLATGAGGGAAQVPAPQRLVPSLAGPLAGAATRAVAPSVVAAATPAPAPAAAAPAEPAEDEGLPATEELPSAGTPARREGPTYTPRQTQLRNENRFLSQMMGHPGADAGRRAGIQQQINENNAEFAEIEAARTSGDKEREAARKVVTGQAAKDRSKLMVDMGQQAQNNIDLRDQLTGLKRIADSPNSPFGFGGKTRAYIGSLGIEVNKILKETTGEGLAERLGPDAYNRWLQDPASRRRTAEALLNAITLKNLGGKLGSNVSNADREYVSKMNASISDDPETIKRIADMHIALIDRQQLMHKIAVQGVAAGKTADQIQSRLTRFGRETPLFEGNSTSEKIGGVKEGEPTALGRQIDPTGARDWDAKQKGIRERAAKAGEEFRDTSGAGEAAVAGYRPSTAEKRTAAERDAAVARVANRPVEGAGSSRASDDPALFAERGERTTEAAGQGVEAVRDFFRGPGRMGYGAEGVGGMPRAAVPTPQRAGEGIDIERGDMGIESLRGVMEQNARLAPGGIPLEAMRRSTNIEDRTGENLSQEALNAAERERPYRGSQQALNDWQQQMARQLYAERQTPNPYSGMAQQAGLADLATLYPGMVQRSMERQLQAQREIANRDRQLAGFGEEPPLRPVQGPPIPLPPLPRPKPRRKEERK